MKFKPILAWIKANLIVVICCVIILAVLPTAFFVSRAWNKGILDQVEKKATAEYNAVTGTSVKYTLPAFDATSSAFSESRVPNAAITAHIKAASERARAQVDVVERQAVDFNRGVGADAAAVGRSPHVPLVDNLFPRVAMSEQEAANPNIARDKEDAKLYEAEDKFIGKRGNPNPYESLLRSVKAGAPIDRSELERRLRDLYARESERMTQGKRRLDDAEAKQLKEQLRAVRLGEYRSHASQLGVYATLDVFPREGMDSAPGAPRNAPAEEQSMFATIPWGSIPRSELTRPKLFMKQWDLWVLSDIFAAVRLANTENGKLLPVDKAVVKRIEKITLRNPEGMESLDPKPAGDDMFNFNSPGAPSAPAETIPGITPLDPSVSITGRARGSWNKYYEVRRADMVCVVSSQRLRTFLDAITRVNLMTVTDMDIESAVDSWAELDEGYYYGDEHVVRVRVSIESLWLKSWIAPMMPDEVAKALGVEVPAPTASGGAGGGNTDPSSQG